MSRLGWIALGLGVLLSGSPVFAEEPPAPPVGLAAAKRAVEERPDDLAAHRRYQRLMQQAGRAQDVLQEYRAGVAREPSQAASHYLYARLLDDADEKRRELEEAVKLDPAFVEAYLALGGFYLDQRQFESAEQAYRHALAVNPADADALNDLGVVRLRQDQYDQALEQFQAALAVDPAHAMARYNAGRTYYVQRKYAEAIASLTQAQAADPQNVWPRYYLGLAYYARYLETTSEEDWNAAADGFQAIVAQHDAFEKLANVYAALGYLYERKVNVLAAKYYQRALEIDPDQELAARNLYQRGIPLVDMFQYGLDGITGKKITPQSVTASAAVNPQDRDAQTLEGFAILQGEAPADAPVYRAEARFNAALAANPKNVWALNGLAVCLISQPQQARRAISLLEQAEALQPAFAPSYLHLGNAYLVLSNPARPVDDRRAAKQAYRKALELDPSLAQAYVNVGIAYLMDCAYERAKRAFDAALAMDPANEQAAWNVGLINDLRAYVIDKDLARGAQAQVDGRAERALAIDRKAWEYDRTYPRTYRALGDLYAAQGKTVEAQQVRARAEAFAGEHIFSEPEVDHHATALP